MPSTRRAFLAAVGTSTAISVGGCMGTSQEPLPVTDLRVGQSFEWLQAGVHWQGVTLTDRQSVFVDIPDTAGVQDRTDVSLVVDDRTFDPREAIAGVETTNIAWNSESTGVKPMFSLPLSLESGSIHLEAADGRRYELGDETVDRLLDPPRLSVTRFESAGMDGEDLRVRIAIENAGGHDATFRGNLGSATLSGRERVDFQVPAGETASFDRTVNLFAQEGQETIRFEWGVDSEELQVSEDGSA